MKDFEFPKKFANNSPPTKKKRNAENAAIAVILLSLTANEVVLKVPFIGDWKFQNCAHPFIRHGLTELTLLSFQLAFFNNRSISLVDMYTDMGEPTEKCGELNFGLEYDFATQTLKLKIIQVTLKGI